MVRYLLPIYWVFCVAATHAPLPPSAEPFMLWDKGMHGGMYALLGLLFGWRLAEKDRVPRQIFSFGLLVLAVYGIADELTQPYFARTADPFDWLADVAGAALGLFASLSLRPRLRRLPARAAPPPGP
jgi:VanZ family protein